MTLNYFYNLPKLELNQGIEELVCFAHEQGFSKEVDHFIRHEEVNALVQAALTENGWENVAILLERINSLDADWYVLDEEISLREAKLSDLKDVVKYIGLTANNEVWDKE